MKNPLIKTRYFNLWGLTSFLLSLFVFSCLSIVLTQCGPSAVEKQTTEKDTTGRIKEIEHKIIQGRYVGIIKVDSIEYLITNGGVTKLSK